jgi:nitrite reductase/ring-hydroxylating ferredoxin subunit
MDHNVQYLNDLESYQVLCPHCYGCILIHKDDINCKIFRHAIDIESGNPIDPHTSKEICDDLLEKGKIFGCGKPFLFDGTTIKICDYI